MNVQNPLFFFVDIMRYVANILLDPKYAFWDVPLLIWFVGFLLLSMIISVFWKGARG